MAALKDVQYQVADASKVDWQAVTKAVGKSLPATAKKAVQDVLAEIKAGKRKRAGVQVGLIGKDLYFRVVEGSKTVQDIRIVPNWQAPGQDDAKPDPAYTKVLNEWIKSRQDLRATGKACVTDFKKWSEMASAWSKEAERQFDLAKKGDRAAVPNAKKLVPLIEKLEKKANDAYDDFETEFDKHRSTTGPDILNDNDKKPWGMTYFMTELRPLLNKVQEHRKAIGVEKTRIVDYVEQTNLALSSLVSDEQLMLKSAQAIYRQVAQSFASMQGSMGNQVADTSEAIANDYDSLMKAKEAGNHDLVMANADKSVQRLKTLQTGSKNVQRHWTRLESELTGLKKLPKWCLKVPEIKVVITEINRITKDAKTFKSNFEKMQKASIDNYKKIQKAIAK